MTELGPAKLFLGIEIIQNPEQGAVVLQSSPRILLDSASEKSRDGPMQSTPMPCGIRLGPEVAGPLLNNDDKARYHSAVG